MTTNPSEDYYDILGVPKNATPEQIKAAHRKLIRENHPDQFMGKRRQYEKTGDQELLKILDEKVSQANEKSARINEAYNVLSDLRQREQYDYTRKTTRSSTSSATPPPPPPRPKPEIVLSTNSLDFGVVIKGGNKVKSFTVDNRGGSPDEIHIDWEKVSSWGELVIEPDPIYTFPIKVTVKIKTGRLTEDLFSGRIAVIVDGEEYGVSVSFRVVVPAPAPKPVSPPPPPSPRTTPAPAPAYTPSHVTPKKISWGNIIAAVVAVGIIIAVVSNNAGDNLVTGGLINKVALASAYSTFDVWVNNDSIKSKYITFEVTGRLDDGTVISNVLNNTYAPYYSTLIEAHTQRNWSTYFGFTSGPGQDTQNVTITSCNIIVGDNATVGYSFDTSGTTIPCSP